LTLGSPVEIAAWFGSADKLGAAGSGLQGRLYDA